MRRAHLKVALRDTVNKVMKKEAARKQFSETIDPIIQK